MHFHNYHTQTRYSPCPTPPKEKKLHILVAIFQLLPLANWVRVQLLGLLPRWPQCSNVRMQVNTNRSKVHCIWDCKTCHIDCKGRCLSPAYHEKLYNIKLRIEEWSRKRQSVTRRLGGACDSSPLPGWELAPVNAERSKSAHLHGAEPTISHILCCRINRHQTSRRKVKCYISSHEGHYKFTQGRIWIALTTIPGPTSIGDGHDCGLLA